MSDTEQCPKSPWKSKRHKWQDENGKYTIPETCHWCGMRQDSHPTSQPKPVDGELREKIHEIHGRLHGREITHKEVAKHSHWTPEELQSVLIEDAEIFAKEMQDLFDAHLQVAVKEARMNQMHRMANLHREAGGKGLPMGFQPEMKRLQSTPQGQQS